MLKGIRLLVLSALTGLVLVSCNLFGTATPARQSSFIIEQPTASLSQLVTIQLTVQADPSTPFSAPGQVINYTYNIKNAGGTSTPGPITVTGAIAICPAINTVGNLDDTFDVNETIVCISTYTITQADLDKGSVTNAATASVNGINSNQVITTLQSAQSLALTLTKTATPATYDHTGQAITYAYVITNNSAATLGPAQFTVSDGGFGTPYNCGGATISLAPNATVTCTATYTITQADMDAGFVSTNATASGGSVGPSQPVSVTITKSSIVYNPGNLVPGSTIQHQVVKGEWLWQIARCYGADPAKVVQANPQIPIPAEISPNTTVAVPNIGSVGRIYGPPCVGTYTVQFGDTWNSIAQKYNADPTILQMVNANTLTVGSVIKVPLNSISATP